MILFLFVSVIYIGILLFLKPAPNNLKSPPLTGVQNIKAIKASLFLGILISTIFFFTSNFTFIDTNEAFYQYLALNNNPDLSHLWPIQLITHLFIHVNFIHIICNVCGCGLVSVYERRVGTKRFLIVLSVASLTSIPSIGSITDLLKWFSPIKLFIFERKPRNQVSGVGFQVSIVRNYAFSETTLGKSGHLRGRKKSTIHFEGFRCRVQYSAPMPPDT